MYPWEDFISADSLKLATGTNQGKEAWHEVVTETL